MATAVAARLEKLESDLERIRKDVAFFGGVPRQHAMLIDGIATDIAQHAAEIAAAARTTAGNTSGKTLKRDVRRALGFTKP